jgi:hypothetical protein
VDLFDEKNQSQNISCYCPFKQLHEAFPCLP